ncbi:MAG: hypothetical protein OXC14_12180 [Rhodospirillaceae bacterium]|nr:hypothetical protein [Rhodospirillaceae bacterium]
MSDGGKDNVVDARARFAEAGAQRLRRVRGPGLLEQSGGELHPIHAEIQDLLDQIVDRAEIYEKTGRPDEAERLRAAVAEVIDDLMLRRSKARRLRERRRQKKSEGEDST